MSAKFFQFKKNLFLAILLLVIFVLPSKVLAENLLTVGSANSNLTGTDSAIFSNIGSISATTTSLIRLQKNGVDLFKVDSTGNVTMGNFLTSISAANVSSGAFGSLSGNGNYSFPGNVGIGTTTPAARLNIYSTSSIEEMFRLSDASGSSAANKYINWYSNNGGTTLTDFARIGAGYGSDYINSFMAFSVADGARVLRERVRIDVNGNVGVGTTNPGAKLDVNGWGRFEGGGASNRSDSGAIEFYNNYSSSANVHAQIKGMRGLNNLKSGQLGFFTAAPTTGTLSERMTINENGNVGIGNPSPGYKLDVNGEANFGIGTTTNRLHNVSAPTYGTDAANKNYVDSVIAPAATTTVGLQSGFWTTGANSSIFNNNTGGVGIGTNNPSAKIHVVGNGTSFAGVFQNNQTTTSWSSTYAAFNLANTNTTANNHALFSFSDNTGVSSTAGIGAKFTDRTNHYGDLYFYTKGTDGYNQRLYIQSDGSVGIGTTAPGSLLDLAGNFKITSGGIVYNTNSSYRFNFSDIFGDNNSLKVQGDLNSAGVLETTGTTRPNYVMGNLGIGTTAPLAKLDVNGSMRLGGVNVDLARMNNAFVLFDSQPFIEGEYWPSGGGPQAYAYINSADQPFGKVAVANSNSSAYSDFIPVNPGDALYGEIWAMRDNGASGTAGTLYYGIERYDKNKLPIALNNGTQYFVASGVTVPTTGVWQKYSNHTILPTTHTSYNGSDGGPVRYVRIRLLFNYNAGTIPTYWGGVILRKVSANSNNDTGRISFQGSVGIGTDAPTKKLDIAGDLLVRNAATFNSSITATALSGTAGRILAVDASGTFYATSSSIATGLPSPSGISGQTLRSNGTSWIANNLLYNNGTNVGIGTSNPLADLHIGSGGLGYIDRTRLIIQPPNHTGGPWKVNARDDSTYGYLDFAYGANKHVTLNSSGNVGIGITNPAYKLDVNGVSRFRDYALFSSVGRITWDTPGFIIRADSTNKLNLGGGGRNFDLVIDTIGSVGIGTTTPQVALDVNGLIKMRASNITTTSDVINKGYLDSALETLSSSTNALNYWAANGTNIYNKNTGNVGIGVTAPGSRLQINGSTSDNSANALDIKSSAGASYLTVRNDGFISINNGTTAQTKLYSANSKFIFSTPANYVSISGHALNELSALPLVLQPNSGNVGIGTTNPGAKLHVSGGGYIFDGDRGFYSGSYTSNGLWGGTATPNKLKTNGYGNGSFILGYQDNGNGLYSPAYGFEVKSTDGRPVTGNVVRAIVMKDVDNGTYPFYVNNNGSAYFANNVGIGTTTPNRRLDLGGGTNGRIYGLDTATNAVFTDSEVVPKKWIVDNFVPATAKTYEYNFGGYYNANTPEYIGTILTYGNGSSGTFSFEFSTIGETNMAAGIVNVSNLGGSAVPYVRVISSDRSNAQILAKRRSDPAVIDFYYTSPQTIPYTPRFKVYNTSSYQSSAPTTPASWDFTFNLNTLYARNIIADGNVGIGTPTPGYKLDVAGNLRVGNAATFNSSITLTSMMNSGDRILMVGNDGVLYSTSSSIATGLPSPSGISGQTLRSNGTSWVANNLLYNNGTNVGIGTAAPSQKLDVQGNIAIANNMIGGGKNYGNSGNSASAYLQLYDNSTGRTTLNNQVYAIDFQTATTSRLFITNGGNVGIGTTNPTNKLQIGSNPLSWANNDAIISNSNGGIAITNASGYSYIFGSNRLDLYGNSVNTLSLSSGNVGIGVTNPAMKLHLLADLNDGIKIGNSSTYPNNISLYNAYADTGALSLYNKSDVRVQLNAWGNNWIMNAVGIGVTNPGAKLDVVGSFRSTSATISLLGNSGDRIVMTDNSGNLYATSTSVATGLPSPSGISGQTLRSNGTSWVANNVLYNNGTNVGIGTSSPTQKLYVEGNIFGSNIYAPSIENFKQTGSLTNKTITVDTTQIAQSPISPFLWHDVIAFSNPAFETSVDGSSWVSSTTDRRLFSQKQHQSITVLNPVTTKAVRWTWSTGVQYSMANWVVIAHTYSHPAPNKTILMESSADGSTWTQIHSSTYTTMAAPVWHYIPSIGTNAYFRITITSNSGSSINLSGIRLLTSRWGDQGKGSELSFPYNWDENKNITLSGSLGLLGGTASSLGLKFASDTNTGLYNNGSDYLGIVTGGTERLTILNNGNVGIGTTTPSASLDIFGNFKITSGGLVYNTNSSYRFNFSDIFGDHNSLIAQGDINTAGVLETAGTDRPNYMMGNLGIGTTAPGQGKLHLSGDINDSDYVTYGRAQLVIQGNTDSTDRLNIGFETTNRYGFIDTLDYGANWSDPLVLQRLGGNVGIGTTAPNAAYKLDVAGKINASGGLCMNGVCQTSWNVFPVYSTSTPLNLNGGNIINVNKLTVGTIDPLYRIDGTNYSSFAAAIVGGVKEEYLGRVKISELNKNKEYEYRLDFSKLSAPDELWVWRQTVDFSPENVEVNLTPYGAFANIYYIIENEAIIFRADKPVTVSYRLSGKRVDWQNWPTKAKDQQEKPSFIINKGKVIK